MFSFAKIGSIASEFHQKTFCALGTKDYQTNGVGTGEVSKRKQQNNL